MNRHESLVLGTQEVRSSGPGVGGIAGCPFVIFYGEVSADSDGPLELCRPIAGTGAHDRQPASTFRQVLIADQRTATGDTLVFDLSVSLR